MKILFCSQNRIWHSSKENMKTGWNVERIKSYYNFLLCSVGTKSLVSCMSDLVFGVPLSDRKEEGQKKACFQEEY